MLLGGNTVDGEVRSVDDRRDRITLRDRRGRNETLRYDRSTVVVHRQRRYPVTALERGDEVRVYLADSRSGTRRAERIDVLRTANEGRRSGSHGTDRLDGRVGQVDRRRGQFTLEPGRGSRVLVYVPPGVSRSDARRFERLRRGDRVRTDVRFLARNQAELLRFR